MDKMSSSGATTPDTSFTGVSSSTQVIPTAATEQQSFVPGLPFQMSAGMAPFFANPFISPFMPQQGVTDNNTTPVGGFFLSPTQYQEMMQQYFTQMMSANQYGMNISFPMPFSSTLVRPNSQASQIESVTEGVDELNVKIKDELDSSGSTSAREPTSSISTNSSSLLRDANLQSNGEGSAACIIHSSEIDDRGSISANGIESESIVDGVVDSHDKECVGKPISVEDERTTSLIKKQMSEIEKEITRRSQNKNIKKIDDRELAELIGSTVTTVSTITSNVSALEEHVFTPTFLPVNTHSQSALPYSPPVEIPKPVQKETMNQLRSSFNLPDTGSTTHTPPTSVPSDENNITSLTAQTTRSVPYYSHSTTAYLAHQPTVGAEGPSNPMSQPFMSTFAQHQMPFATQFSNTNFIQNGAQHFTAEQLAVAFIQQQQAQEQVPLSHSTESTIVSSSNSIAPPPPPVHPVRRRSSLSTPSCSEWPDENKENGSGDEPVWVLRDSYLKRMQRDEREQVSEWREETTTPTADATLDNDELETDRLLLSSADQSGLIGQSTQNKKKNSKETMVHEPAVLIEGVLFRAKYLGSTQMMCESRGSKAARMAQAQEAVARVKAPEGEIQPSTEIDLFISTEKIMVLNTDLQRISDTDVRQDILMDHALRTISYIADIGDLVVLMARRMSASSSDEHCSQVENIRKSPKVICHVFESDEASFIAQSIGQAFQVAYVEFLRANGIDDPSYLRQIDYQEVLNSQELLGDELEMFARKETQKDVVVPKKTGEPLGIVVVESGWGSMLPTVVLAHMNPSGPAARSNQLNIGDQIININGISLVGLPLSAAQTNIKNVKSATAVRLTVVSTPPVVEVRIRRPDTKYQLGFSVQNGVICSLLRGGIAERGGIRVGHCIIEINNQSVVAVAHDRIVSMLATAIGEIHMKTMPTSMFRLLTGQEIPQYI